MIGPYLFGSMQEFTNSTSPTIPPCNALTSYYYVVAAVSDEHSGRPPSILNQRLKGIIIVDLLLFLIAPLRTVYISSSVATFLGFRRHYHVAGGNGPGTRTTPNYDSLTRQTI